MNTKRLTILRDALIDFAGNPENLKFDIAEWFRCPQEKVDPTKAVRGAMRGENYCGTAACALGIAATIPAFRAAGLRFDPCGYPAFRGELTFEAAASFFKIDIDDSYEIFGGTHYDTGEWNNPLAVADKITALLMTA